MHEVLPKDKKISVSAMKTAAIISSFHEVFQQLKLDARFQV